MGKVSTTEMTMKKKKGRPSKNSISLSAPQNPRNYDSPIITYTRSAIRNPSIFNSPPSKFFVDGDDEDERKEKKAKLVARLPQSEQSNPIENDKQHSRDCDSASGSGSDSGPESEDRTAHADKRNISGGDRGSDGAVAIQEKKTPKATGTPIHGSPLESGPTALLPDKKLLVFILDRLQKKDTYGVFSEPVNINELPDYFEVIDQPMDFGTVRKKVDGGAYKSLEELEADVFLICSNAMQYNAPDTVYYRQARTIQEIAKRDFANLRHEGANGEPQPKVVRRGRPPGNKNQKKILETTSPVERAAPELPSGTTGGSNSYNLRKAPPLNRYRSSDMFVSSYRSRNGENYSEWLADWNDEFPAKILRADMKHGKKHFTVDETRRDTYKQFYPKSYNSSALSNSIGDTKLLVPVGLHEPLAYARSVARFAASLGPVAWKVASRKIEAALPDGVQYGPGWVGLENKPPHSQLLSFSTEKQISNSSSAVDFCNSNKPRVTPSASGLNSVFAPPEGMVEAVRKLNNSSSQLLRLQGSDAPYMKTPFPVIVQQKQQPAYQSQSNGVGRVFGYDTSAQAPPLPSQALGPTLVQDEVMIRENRNFVSIGEGETWKFGKSSWPAQLIRHSPMGPPDLNVRFQAGSPSSSGLQIGSPQPPDLALQL